MAKATRKELLHILTAIDIFWSGNQRVPLSPGAYITEEDKPIADVIAAIIERE